jgi:outer membrane protein TolC
LPNLNATSTRTSGVVKDPDSSGVFTETINTVTRFDAGISQRLPLGGDIQIGYSFSKTGEDLLAGYGGNISVVQPLLRNFGWKTAFSSVNSAKLSERAVEEALHAQTLALMFEVESAYYLIIQAKQEIAVNERAIERDEALLSFSQAKVEAKLATRRDVLSAEIVLEQDRGRLLTAQTTYRDRIDALADVLGLRIPTTITIAETDLDETVVPITETEWMARAMRDNPSIRNARFDLESIELDLKVSKNARLPQLDLEFRYDENRNSVADGGGSFIRPVERAWQGTVTASMPIFNSRPRAETRAANLRYEQARRTLVEAERRVGLLVRDAIRDLERSSDRMEVLKKTIEGAKDKVEFANVNFQLGRADNFDITDAQKDLIEGELDYNDELVSYYIALARLEELLGGSIH